MTLSCVTAVFLRLRFYRALCSLASLLQELCGRKSQGESAGRAPLASCLQPCPKLSQGNPSAVGWLVTTSTAQASGQNLHSLAGSSRNHLACAHQVWMLDSAPWSPHVSTSLSD